MVIAMSRIIKIMMTIKRLGNADIDNNNTNDADADDHDDSDRGC